MSNVPKLRFSDFNDEWSDVLLREVVEFQNGKAHEKDISETGHFIVVNSKFISTNGEVKKYSDSQISPLFKGDIVMVMSDVPNGRALAKCFLIDKDETYTLNQRICSLRARDSNNSFLRYRINRNPYYLMFDSGVGQTNLKKDEVLDLPLKVPQLAEQQKIADFLTAVDTKIEQLTRKVELLKQYKKGVMQKIFSQEIRFKADDGSEFPEWGLKLLSDVFQEVSDKVGNSDVETYSISAGKGFVSQKEKFGRNISGQQNEKYIVLQPNQFSYNKGNSKSYTYGCVYPNRFNHSIALPNVFISFKFRDSGMDVNFYASLFEGHYLDRWLRRIISSSARMDGLLNVNKADFFKIKVPVPSNTEQEKVGVFLGALDQRVAEATSQLHLLQTFKKGLLQQMFV